MPDVSGLPRHPSMLDRLGAPSRSHLRAMAAQIAFLLVVAVPTLFVDPHAPRLYLQDLRATTGITALVTFAYATWTRQKVSFDGICLWDSVLVFCLVKSGCTVALWIIGPP